VTETRKDRLEKYTIEDAEMLNVCITQLDAVPGNHSNIINQLKGYHPGLGESYRVSCRIFGEGGESHLKIVLPDPGDDNGWGEAGSNRRKLINPLKYVPMPDANISPQGLLYLSKEIIESDDSKLGLTQWRIVHSRLHKMKFKTLDKHDRPVISEVNSVIFCWNHPDLNEYVVTGWKW